jgi:hypothetical protein
VLDAAGLEIARQVLVRVAPPIRTDDPAGSKYSSGNSETLAYA